MDENEPEVRQKWREKDEVKEKKEQRSRKWYRVRN